MGLGAFWVYGLGFAAFRVYGLGLAACRVTLKRGGIPGPMGAGDEN